MTGSNQTMHRLTDAEQICRRAAEALVAIGRDSIVDRGRFFLALAGGQTPRALYHLLTEPEFRQALDWSQVEFFWGDERTVPADHEDSNYRMAYETLLGPLDIAAKRIHRMQAERADLTAAAVEYERQMATVLGTSHPGPPPNFDLILLGMGEDGHTASLFPHTDALDPTDRWVVANDVPKLSTRRMTMTALLINASRHVFFLVSGKSKAAALARVRNGPPAAEELPSQLIRPSSGHVEWFVSDAASS